MPPPLPELLPLGVVAVLVWVGWLIELPDGPVAPLGAALVSIGALRPLFGLARTLSELPVLV